MRWVGGLSGIYRSPHPFRCRRCFGIPYGTCEPQHGITTVVMGNCGLTLAPVKNGDEDAMVKSFVRVEAIPRFALEQGVKWGWHSYGEYLDNLEGKVGINVGGLVGHIAVRHNAMGEEAVERKATGKEVQQMRGLVLEAMEGGALGMSTNRNERHMREDGKPVASRLADDEEFFALCDVLAERNAGMIETILGRNKIEHFQLYHELASARKGRFSGRACNIAGPSPISGASSLPRWSRSSGRLSGLWIIPYGAAGAAFRA